MSQVLEMLDCGLQLAAISTIGIDGSYQRPIDSKRVAKMAKAFSSGAIKAVSLSRRGDGSLWCYDGQHTIAVLKAMGKTHVHAMVVAGDQKKEAEWFALMNGSGTNKATVRSVQQAEVVAGGHIACLVGQMLSGYGISVSSGGSKAGTTSAIGSIRIWARADHERLINVMDAIYGLWASEDHAWSQIVMRGMWDVVAEPAFEKVWLALKKKKVTPRRILDSASAMQSATGQPGGGSGYAKQAILKLAGIKP